MGFRCVTAFVTVDGSKESLSDHLPKCLIVA